MVNFATYREISVKGLEGIALETSGDFLFLVKEGKNEIIKVKIKTQEIAAQTDFSELSGKPRNETLKFNIYIFRILENGLNQRHHKRKLHQTKRVLLKRKDYAKRYLLNVLRLQPEI